VLAFLRWVQEDDDLVAVVPESSDSPRIQPIETNDLGNHSGFYLWNRRFLPKLKRKWIPGPRHYGVSVLDSAVLEFSGSRLVTWEAKPALIQGRLYGIFDPYLEKPHEFEKWYEHLVRWIRRNYQRNPTSMGGYTAPAAHRLFQDGGYLLPQFEPPRTDVWLAEIDKQHPGAEGRTETGQQTGDIGHRKLGRVEQH
jgi:hypothetical protein